MKWKILILGMFFLIIATCIVLFVGHDDIEYNNIDGKDILITTMYSSSEIDKIQYDISCGGMSLRDLTHDFKIECIRKTYQGYYVILEQDDGKNAFIFLDDSLQVVSMLVLDDFKSKKDFELNVTKGMTMEQVLLFDSDTVPSPFSAVYLTIHPVQEGTYFVWYKRDFEGKLLNEPIVESIEFFDNGEDMADEDDLSRRYVPYILEIDRVSG